jgi:hypothetical protein
LKLGGFDGDFDSDEWNPNKRQKYVFNGIILDL